MANIDWPLVARKGFLTDALGLFACRLAWRRHGDQQAYDQLLRASRNASPDLRLIASTFLCESEVVGCVSKEIDCNDGKSEFLPLRVSTAECGIRMRRDPLPRGTRITGGKSPDGRAAIAGCSAPASYPAAAVRNQAPRKSGSRS
jgi:hypothetical protein